MRVLLNVGKTLSCTIIRRVNRFVVEVVAERRTGRAYITNTGRLEEYLREGRKGFCLPGGKKTDYRLFAIEEMGKGVLIDTGMQMKAFERAVKFIPWLHTCKLVKRNVRVGRSLVDYLFCCKDGPFYLEVKSAVLRGNSYYAMYPDCPTERGRKHIKELMRLAISGTKAGIVFIAALPNIKKFKPYSKGDPEISRLLGNALKIGVTVRAIGMYYEPQDGSIMLYSSDLPVEI